MMFQSLRTRIALGFGLVMALLMGGSYVSIWQLGQANQWVGTDQTTRLEVMDAANQLSRGLTTSQHDLSLALSNANDTPDSVDTWRQVIDPAFTQLTKIAQANPGTLQGEMKYDLQIIEARLAELRQAQNAALDNVQEPGEALGAIEFGPLVNPLAQSMGRLLEDIVETEQSHQASEARQALRADLHATHANLIQGLAALGRYANGAAAGDFKTWDSHWVNHQALVESLGAHAKLLGKAQLVDLTALNDAADQIETLTRNDQRQRDTHAPSSGQLHYAQVAAPLASELNTRLQSLTDLQRKKVAASQSDALGRLGLLSKFQWGLLVAGGAFCLICAVCISGSIAAPLRRLVESGRQVAQADSDVTVESEGPLEVRQIADVVLQFKCRQDATVRAVDALALGRLDETLRPAGPNDMVARSLQRLADSLRETQERVGQRVDDESSDGVGSQDENGNDNEVTDALVERLNQAVVSLELVCDQSGETTAGLEQQTDALTASDATDRLDLVIAKVLEHLKDQSQALADATTKCETLAAHADANGEDTSTSLQQLEHQIATAIVVLDAAVVEENNEEPSDQEMPEGALGQSVGRILEHVSELAEATKAAKSAELAAEEAAVKATAEGGENSGEDSGGDSELAAEELRQQLDSAIHAIDATASDEGRVEAIEAIDDQRLLDALERVQNRIDQKSQIQELRLVQEEVEHLAEENAMADSALVGIVDQVNTAIFVEDDVEVLADSQIPVLITNQQAVDSSSGNQEAIECSITGLVISTPDSEAATEAAAETGVSDSAVVVSDRVELANEKTSQESSPETSQEDSAPDDLDAAGGSGEPVLIDNDSAASMGVDVEGADRVEEPVVVEEEAVDVAEGAGQSDIVNQWNERLDELEDQLISEDADPVDEAFPDLSGDAVDFIAELNADPTPDLAPGMDLELTPEMAEEIAPKLAEDIAAQDGLGDEEELVEVETVVEEELVVNEEPVAEEEVDLEVEAVVQEESSAEENSVGEELVVEEEPVVEAVEPDADERLSAALDRLIDELDGNLSAGTEGEVSSDVESDDSSEASEVVEAIEETAGEPVESLEPAASTTLVLDDPDHQCLIDSFTDGVVTIDEEGLVQSFNAAAEQMFGFKAEVVVGKNVGRLLESPFNDLHQGFLQDFVPAGQEVPENDGHEVRGRRADGEVFALLISVSEVLVEGKRYFAGCLRDISAPEPSVEDTVSALADADLIEATEALQGKLKHLVTSVDHFNQEGGSLTDHAIRQDSPALIEEEETLHE